MVIIAEIVTTTAVAHATSWGFTVVLLAGVSILGLSLIKRELRAVMRGARGNTGGSAAVPDQIGVQWADAVVRVGGALLVAVPGLVTGAVGLVLLTPPVRVAARRVIGPRWARTLAPLMKRAGRLRGHGATTYADDHDVIDGETGDRRPSPRRTL